MKIAEVKALDDGDIINEVSGTLVSIFDRKSGENSKGQWSLQDAILKDETGEMKLILSNRPVLGKEYRGEQVTIACHKGDKGKSGLYAKDHTYDGVTKRQIKMTGTGRFIFNTEGSVNHADEELVPVKAAQAKNTPVYGQTVGMAINNAVSILRDNVKELAYYKDGQFSRDVYQIASDLVRVSQLIEQGRLAPSSKERESVTTVEVDEAANKVIRQMVEAGKQEELGWPTEE